MGTPILLAAAITSVVGRRTDEITNGNSSSCIRAGSNTCCGWTKNRYPPTEPGDADYPTDAGLRIFRTSRKLVAFVERAYEYAHEHGRDAALHEFNNQTGRFVEGELYIFAYDTKGNTLALPFQPDILGKNRWNVTDANGTAFIREIVETALSGGGFVHYLYSDPLDNFNIKSKLSYVMMVDQDWIIGSGIYEAQGDNPIVRVGEIRR